jgi:DNA-binding PadR family transcriptional regulator
MAAIDLIVLGMLKKESLSAYDIQKLVEYRSISKWVKISTPSIYKKVIQLEKKKLIKSIVVKEGNMPEKAVYSLTKNGEREFEKLMIDISAEPVLFFLDFNAVIVNLQNLPGEKQKTCLRSIKNGIQKFKASLKENIDEKENLPEISETGMAVLQQQYALALAIEKWIAAMKTDF